MSRRRGRFRTVTRGLVSKEAPPNRETEITQKFDPYVELGATGLKRSAGYILEEFERKLQGQKGALVYREMVDNSSIIGAALYALKSLIRKAEWKWESPEAEMEQENPEEGAPELDAEGNPIEPKKPPFSEDEPKPPVKAKVRKVFPPKKEPVEGEEPTEDEPLADDELLEEDDETALPGGQPDPAEFMEQVFQDMSTSWPDTLTEILTLLEYGYAPLEITYKVREGSENLAENPGESSRYDDGLIGLRKMALRAQETVTEWIFDEAGGVQGLVQQAAPEYMRIELPIQKLLLFRTTTEKNNPEGRSALRSAYFDWYFYKRLVEISAIGAERDLAGLPKVSIPAEVLNAGGTAASAWRDVAENVRVDEQGGLVIPSDVDPETKARLYDVELLAGAGAKSLDIKALIERHESRIAMVLAADWLLLGHTEVGARSLGDSKMDMFTMAIEGTMDAICDVINRHLVPRLFALNGWPLDSLPVLKHGSVNKSDVTQTMEMLKGLTAAGADVFPDETLVKHFYSMLKWPTEGRDEALVAAEQNRLRMEEAMSENGVAVNPITGEPQPAPAPGTPPPFGGKPKEEPPK